ncbi:MAG TPA: porin [Thermoanaerobaculia bacterium]|nr:porin [Thermoanaerobaculia bacterium]
MDTTETTETTAAPMAAPVDDPGSIVVRPAGSEPTLLIGGLIQGQFDGGDKGDARFANDNERFYLRRARLNATGKFLEDFDFRLEMDLSNNLNNTSAERAQLTDGYINWNHFSFLNVKVGQFKTPFGFEQLYADARLLTIERSLANDRLTLNRQVGLGLAGDLLDKHLSYSVGAFNGNGANNSFNDNNKFDWVGRVVVTPWRGQLMDAPASFSIAANGFTAEDTALALTSDLGIDSTPTTADRDGIFTGKRRGQGADAQFVSGRLEIWGEYLNTRYEPDNDIPKPQFKAKGGYVLAAFFIVPKKFQILAKQETFDPNDSVKNDQTDATTLGLNYYIRGNDLKVMLDYLRVKVGRQDSQDKLIARLQVGF